MANQGCNIWDKRRQAEMTETTQRMAKWQADIQLLQQNARDQNQRQNIVQHTVST